MRSRQKKRTGKKETRRETQAKGQYSNRKLIAH